MENQFNDYGLYGHKKLEIFKNALIPQHIRMNYPNFVNFIEIYLKKITQEHEGTEFIHNMLAYANIDETSAFFLEEFCKNYLKDLLYLPEINKRTLVKWIRQWYEATGSQQSFQFLFRVLYNQDVSFYFPSVDIFRVSDGKWAKEYIIRVRVNEEDVDKFNDDMIGTEIVGNINGCRALFENYQFHQESYTEEITINPETYMQRYVIQPTPEEIAKMNEVVGKKVWYTCDVYVTDFDQQKSIANLLPNEEITFTYLTEPKKKVTATITHIISSIVIKEGSNRGIFYNIGDEIKIDHPFGENAKCVVERVSSGYFYGLKIVDGGSGYAVNDRIGLNDGHGIGFYAFVSKVGDNGEIEAVTIGNTGENYLYFPRVIIETEEGEGARLIPLTENVGAIEAIKILEPGTGYREIEESDIHSCFYKKFSVNGCSNIPRYDQGYDGVIQTITEDREGYSPGSQKTYTSAVSNSAQTFVTPSEVFNNLKEHHTNITEGFIKGKTEDQDNVMAPKLSNTQVEQIMYSSMESGGLGMLSNGTTIAIVPDEDGYNDWVNPGRSDFTNKIVIQENVGDTEDGVYTLINSPSNISKFKEAANLIWKDKNFSNQSVVLGKRNNEATWSEIGATGQSSMKSILNIRKPYSFPLQFEKVAIRPSAISNVIVQFYIDNDRRKEMGNFNDLRLGEIVFAEVSFMKFEEIMEKNYNNKDWDGDKVNDNMMWYEILNKSLEINKDFIDWAETTLTPDFGENWMVELYGHFDEYVDRYTATLENPELKKKLMDFKFKILQESVLRYPYGYIKRLNNDMGYALIDKYDGYEFMEGMELRGTSSGSYGNIILSTSFVKFEYETGPLFKIPSYYKNDDGQIDSKKKIQDSYFYQCYSYVLNSKIDKKEWEEPVNETVHPSGLIVFGNGEVTNHYGISYGGDRIDIIKNNQTYPDEIIHKLDSLYHKINWGATP